MYVRLFCRSLFILVCLFCRSWYIPCSPVKLNYNFSRWFYFDCWFLSLDKGCFLTMFQISQISRKSAVSCQVLQQIEQRSVFWDVYLLHERGLLRSSDRNSCLRHWYNFSKVSSTVTFYNKFSRDRTFANIRASSPLPPQHLPALLI